MRSEGRWYGISRQMNRSRLTRVILGSLKCPTTHFIQVLHDRPAQSILQQAPEGKISCLNSADLSHSSAPSAAASERSRTCSVSSPRPVVSRVTKRPIPILFSPSFHDSNTWRAQGHTNEKVDPGLIADGLRIGLWIQGLCDYWWMLGMAKMVSFLY